MKNFSILIDTREKDPAIQKELDSRGIPYKRKKLDYADYSFEYNGESYENKIAIERKCSVDEIIGNFTKGRGRFAREFERAKGCKVYLMVEANREDIDKRKYRSSLPPSKLISFLKTWSYKFGLELKFVKKEESTQFILNTFKKYLGGNSDGK